MSFPATAAALEAAGYSRECYSRCKGCRAAMEWWTTPRGQRIPIDPMPGPDSPAISHFATCPKASQFRKEPQRCTTPPTTPELPLFSEPLFSSPSSPSSSTARPAPPSDEQPKKEGEA